MTHPSDFLKNTLEHSRVLQEAYLTAYRLLLPGRYRRYRDQASEEALHAGLAQDTAADMLRETLLFGTFFEEYILYHFDQISPEQRRSYLTDSVRNRICNRINEPRAQKMLLDKYEAYLYFKSYYQRDAMLYASRADLEAAIRFAEELDEIVVKPLCNCAGRGIVLHKFSKEDTPRFLKSLKGSFILEQRIRQTSEMGLWNPASVNTIRVNTILKDNEYTLFNTFIRTGRKGSFVDNGAQGGLFASIDPENGCIITEACDEKGRFYSSHPDSGIPFKGTFIPRWDELKELAFRLAKEIPQLVYVGWDLALTDDGWVMVEGNKGQFIAQQLTLQRGLRREFELLADR